MRSGPTDAALPGAPPAAPLEVAAVDDAAALPGLAVEWAPLVVEDEPGAVFRSGDWLLPWWNRFSPGKDLRVLTARRGGRLVGTLPAYRARTRLGVRQLRLLGDGIVGSDHLGA